MNNKEFLKQRACDMTVKELLKAATLKIKLDTKPKENKELTFAEEIQKYPEQFERLNQDCKWEDVNGNGVSYNGTTKVLNSKWNSDHLDNKVFYAEFTANHSTYKEIIRRKVRQ